MRFSTFVLLPIAAAVAAPQAAVPATPDLDQINEGIAEAQAAIAKILGARQADPATAAAAPAATDASGNSSGGIGSTLGDLSTLLTGLSDTLTGVCNLRDDISSLTSSLTSSLGL